MGEDTKHPPDKDCLADAECVQRVLAGEREVFRTLVERHQRRVYLAALRVVRHSEDAEDVAQETFLRAYQALGRYDTRWQFTTWIVTIATRTALNAVRAKRGESPMHVEDMVQEPADVRSGRAGFENAARQEWLENLRREVGELGDKMRTVFGLRYEDGMSIREIAQATGDSENSVKVTLHRARKTLAKQLRRFAEDAGITGGK